MSVIEKAVAKLRGDNLPGDNAILEVPPADTEIRAGTIKSRADGTICQLDFDALRAAGYITGTNENTKLAEEYRIIKRPILANAFGKGAAPVNMGNLVMITSAIPGEGKTFTSINLALSIALERDTTALLVDADVLNPQLSRLFGLDKRPGLIDVVDNPKKNLSEIIVNTDNPKFRIIPAGATHEHSTELLASERMRQVCEELSHRYPDRVIIFDAPPFLNTTQAKVLTRFMGQIIIVVEAGQTNNTAITETTEQLGDDKVIGMVLNKSIISRRGVYGGYYGIYGE